MVTLGFAVHGVLGIGHKKGVVPAQSLSICSWCYSSGQASTKKWLPIRVWYSFDLWLVSFSISIFYTMKEKNMKFLRHLMAIRMVGL